MRRLTVLILLILLPAVLLSACAKPNKALSAAKLLDLGDKYLLEMDYEQAVVKFLEAIEVEPKNPRGYLGAAAAYAALGQTDKAIEILQKGLDAIPENAELQRILKELEQAVAGEVEGDSAETEPAITESEPSEPEPSSDVTEPVAAEPEPGPAQTEPAAAEPEPTPPAAPAPSNQNGAAEVKDGPRKSQSITVSGVIFQNLDKYRAQYYDYNERYSTIDVSVAIYSDGVSFLEPVVVNLDDGTAVTLSEAVLGSLEVAHEEISGLIGKRLIMTGYFKSLWEGEFAVTEKYENGRMQYTYKPNGDYMFMLESYSFKND